MNPRSLFSALILATLVTAPVLAVAQPYGNNGYNGNNGAVSRQVTGTIVSVQGSSLTLDGGRTIFLHQGTVINPSGTRLAAGMQISVNGSSSDRLTLNADQINITGNAYNNGNGYGVGNARQITGTIVSVQGSSLTLNGGQTVFLHQGTVINPTGQRLRAGMQITAIGVRSGRLRFNANEIDITGRRRQN
jgi:hypothetical protein